MIELWNTETGERLHTLQGSSEVVRPLAFSPNGMTLAVEEKDVRSGRAQVTLWDVATGDALRALNAGQSVKLVRDWYFSQDDTTMISLLEDEQRRTNVVWWDVATGERLRSWSLADIEEPTHRNVHRIAVSPDEALFVFGLTGVEFFGGLVIWDVSTGPVATNDYPTSACDLAFSPDGTLVALTAHSNTIVLWDTGTAGACYVLVSDSSGLCEIAWSPDGRMLAAGAGDGTIVLWEAP
jgi:WD40 repeat protein